MSDNAKANGASTLPQVGYELWAPALVGAATLNGKMYEGLAVLGCEWISFVNRRLKEDFAFPQRVSACRSPDEVRDAYVGFWRQAVDDYQKELAVMTKLGCGFLSSSLTAIGDRAEETAREQRRKFSAAA